MGFPVLILWDYCWLHFEPAHSRQHRMAIGMQKICQMETAGFPNKCLKSPV